MTASQKKKKYSFTSSQMANKEMSHSFERKKSMLKQESEPGSHATWSTIQTGNIVVLDNKKFEL